MNKLLLVALLGFICISGVYTCDDGEWDDSGTCKDCATNCKTCSSADIADCTVCVDGYYGTGSCTACPTGCATCDSATECTSCTTDGEGVAADGKSCTKCKLANCVECEDDYTMCTECDAGYFISDSGKTTAKCTACGENCDECTDADTCDTCSDGYIVNDDDGCDACTNGCASCTDIDDYCKACPTGHILNKTDEKAAFCCSTNCTTCSGPEATKCLSCTDGNKFNADKGTCTSSGFKTGASLTLGAIVSVALFSLLF